MTIWVRIYLMPRDVTYLKAKLEDTNVQRLTDLGYRVEVVEEDGNPAKREGSG